MGFFDRKMDRELRGLSGELFPDEHTQNGVVVSERVKPFSMRLKRTLVLLPIVVALMVIAIRGGLQGHPIRADHAETHGALEQLVLNPAFERVIEPLN